MASPLSATDPPGDEINRTSKRSRRRLPLARNSRRLGYEKRLRLLLWLFSLPLFALAAVLLAWANATSTSWTLTLLGLLAAWAILQAWLTEQLLRPLQTLSNVVAALREEDYSFRARGARRGDSLGDLALEINALAADLQSERLSSLESAAMVRRVVEAIDAPVLAFDEKEKLRLLNPAAVRLLLINPKAALGKPASALGLVQLLSLADEQVTSLGPEPNAVQWMVRRSAFRQHGIPHTLILLSDVSLALRQEERQAWQRLIRVLGHEINNSLTPIKSIAGSLRQMVQAGASSEDFARPLEVIEQRAESLNHFLSAYRRLAQLPPPRRSPFSLGLFLEQLAPLETRLPVRIDPGPDITINADKDQLGQAIINLLRNAAEASLENPARAPQLALSWKLERQDVIVRVRDSGLGVANPSNLFVPFYTTKESGTGIGLALVKTIVEAHQGSITLIDHPEGGAQAELRLPL
jgi:nitrogen fixation/metabolism regulation signal transduction histidine kinase